MIWTKMAAGKISSQLEAPSSNFNLKMNAFVPMIAILFGWSPLIANELILTEEGVRALKQRSQMIVIGEIVGQRQVAFFNQATGLFIGRTEKEAAEINKPDPFATALNCADLKIENLFVKFYENEEL